MNTESNTPTPLTDDHAASFTIDSPGWRRFSQLMERKLKAMTVRAEKAEAEIAFERARNTRLFVQRDEAVEAQEKAEAEVARLTKKLILELRQIEKQPNKYDPNDLP